MYEILAFCSNVERHFFAWNKSLFPRK